LSFTSIFTGCCQPAGWLASGMWVLFLAFPTFLGHMTLTRHTGGGCWKKGSEKLTCINEEACVSLRDLTNGVF
jgi:hypothetical protein